MDFANAFTLAAQANGLVIDPSVEPTPLTGGHNYFLSRSPYELNSFAVFGEAYFNITDALKLTVGARLTSDHKQQLNLPVRLLSGGTGLPSERRRRSASITRSLRATSRSTGNPT